MIFTKKHKKNISKILLSLIASYLIYALVFSSFIFRIHEPTVSNNHHEAVWAQGDIKKSNRPDRVVLLENPIKAAIARIDMVNEADHSLHVAYHSLHPDETTEMFLGLLLEAADRGVEVELLLDGVFHNLRGKFKHIVYTFVDHPQITLKYYEPLDLLKPWTWNNRLHDKIMIADDRYAIIGGRNIGNKYFVQEEKTFVNDRDVMIINSDPNSMSVIHDMQDYFQQIWTHPYAKIPKSSLSTRQQEKASQQHEQLIVTLSEAKNTHDYLFNRSMDWDSLAIEVDHISFIHNPIQRLNKEPWVWLAINELFQTAEETIIIESPYIIPTSKMKAFTDPITLPQEKITMITNSIQSTPNVLAFSGYMHHVESLLNNDINIFEHIGPNSIHGKTYIIDQKISVIGSYNLDARSTFLSTESMVIIESEAFANQLYQQMVVRVEQEELVKLTGGFVSESVSVKIKNFFVTLLSYVTYFFQHLL